MYEKIKSFAEVNGLQATRPVHASVIQSSNLTIVIANGDLAGLP